MGDILLISVYKKLFQNQITAITGRYSFDKPIQKTVPNSS